MPDSFVLLAVPLLTLGACGNAVFVPIDAAVDGQPDGGVDGTVASDVPADLARADLAVCPAPAIADCVSQTGVCDPVCQIGTCDWCSRKCSYVLAESKLVAACAPTGSQPTAHACTVTAAASPSQADDCAPGRICLPPIIGDPATYCFALCRSSADCAYGVACATRKLSAAGGDVAVCDPPYDQCGPDGTCCNPLSGDGCPANRVCLLVLPDSGTGHSRTVCEFAYGDGRNGAPCSTARDCQVRNVCVGGHCQQVCNGVTACPGNATCAPLGSEFGYCP